MVLISVQNDINQLHNVRDIDVAIAVHVGKSATTLTVQNDVNQFHNIRDINTTIAVHIATHLILVVRLLVTQV